MFAYQTSVTVDGVGMFAVNTDFRNILNIFAASDENLDEAEIAALHLRLFYADFETIKPQIYNHPSAFYNAMSNWISGKKKSAKGGEIQTLDYEQDWQMISSAFQHDYHIDLTDENMRLHWHKFLAMLNGLNESNLICKVVGYRALNLSEIKDKKLRAHYMKLKKQYALKSKGDGVMSDKEFDEFLKSLGENKKNS
jgi:hypothetical protein